MKTAIRKENMGQSSFKKHFKCHNSSETFYCGMTRLRNTNLDIFIRCQYTRTISRKKNMRQNLFEKHSKFLIFNKVIYCDMTKRGTNSRKFSENIFTQKYCKKENYEAR